MKLSVSLNGKVKTAIAVGMVAGSIVALPFGTDVDATEKMPKRVDVYSCDGVKVGTVPNPMLPDAPDVIPRLPGQCGGDVEIKGIVRADSED